ncbi:unnamed protein product [Clonostachys byssicola]|uniref:DUF7726 domain-containing protein n=1 Tax=Clonostachys byssicola TaxID=160290 RepID=A0A9N9UHT9_9HYPO|nr:unnamed protein product [Clonostachys byssicola]
MAPPKQTPVPLPIPVGMPTSSVPAHVVTRPAPLAEKDANAVPTPQPTGGKKRKSAGAADGDDKPKRPKKASAKDAQDALLDVNHIDLPGQESRKVPVFDTCREIRKKIKALLRKGVQQAAFVRAMNKGLPDDGGKKVNSMNMKTFMEQKDTMDGNTSTVFYAAYIFFERQRIRDNKPKTAFREEMEKTHGREGVDIVHNVKGGMWLFAGESAHMDKYGKLQISGGR